MQENTHKVTGRSLGEGRKIGFFGWVQNLCYSTTTFQCLLVMLNELLSGQVRVSHPPLVFFCLLSFFVPTCQQPTQNSLPEEQAVAKGNEYNTCCKAGERD